jgi:hypothetical protein
MSGRPYLSLFHAQSSAHDILSKAGGGISLAFNDARELAALVVPLSDAVVRLVTDPGSLGRADPSAYADYTAASIAQRYGGIFDGLAGAARC